MHLLGRLLLIMSILALSSCTTQKKLSNDKYGFDWLHPNSSKCQKISKNMNLAQCREREPGESFGVDRGKWQSCKVGNKEWLVFPSKEICVEMYETMEANAP